MRSKIDLLPTRLAALRKQHAMAQNDNLALRIEAQIFDVEFKLIELGETATLTDRKRIEGMI